MKKICFLVKNIFNQGGDTRAVSLVANKMQEDNEVMIISLFKTESEPSFELNENIHIVSLFDDPFNLRRNYFRVLLKLKKIIDSYKIDILIVGAIGFNSIVYPVTRNKKMKVISCEHASYYDGGKVLGMAWIGRKIACKLMDCVVVLTKKDLDDYIKNMKSIKRIEQIYNPMDDKLIRYPYDSSSKKLITCGRLVNVKGYDYLIEVAKKVFAKYPDWEWHIYGEGPERKYIEDRIQELNLQANVKLIGEVKNIYEKYKDYAAYIMTSRAESFGMVLIEALKSGIPVVSFDCNNGPREIIENGKNGLLITPFNIEEMYENICRLIEDRSLREYLASNSQIGLERFKIDNIYLEWIMLMEKVSK